MYATAQPFARVSRDAFQHEVQTLRCKRLNEWTIMLLQVATGLFIGSINIVIHAWLTVATIRVARGAAANLRARPWALLIGVMIATVLLLMLAHTLEVFVWSITYAVLNVTPEDADLAYFAFVNYTTLGYGDITPVARWRLLGPMTAMNGVLLFGWSTAVIFEVLRETLGRHAAFASS
jgi:Ion channel